MKGKFKKLAAALAAVTVLIGSMQSVAMADDSVYTSIHGGQPKFHKVLVVNDEDSPVPAYTFTYALSTLENDLITTDPAYLSVFKAPDSAAGETTVSATVGTAVFAAADSKDGSPAIANTATVTKSVTIDLSHVTFTKPGIFRYYLEETGSNIGVTYDVNDTLTANTFNNFRTLDVYVENVETTDANGTTHSLRITNYIMYEGKLTTLPTSSTHQQASSAATDDSIIDKNHESGNVITTATKSKGYMNYYDTHSLTIGKKVNGNQGSRDKDFTFTFRVEEPIVGTYIIDKTNAPRSAANIPSTIVIDEDDVTAKFKEQSFTLKSGESITIRGIIHGRNFTVSEDEENYTPSVKVTGDTDGKTKLNDAEAVAYAENAAADTYFDKGTGATGLTSDTTIIFTNELSGVIPTGIIMSVAPAAVVGIGVLAAIIAMVIAGKKRELEEE